MAQINDIFSQKISNKWVYRQQVDTTFALRNAVERENNDDAQQRIQTGIVHITDIGHEARPPCTYPSLRFPVPQKEQGDKPQ